MVLIIATKPRVLLSFTKATGPIWIGLFLVAFLENFKNWKVAKFLFPE
jgi:hypothetical protein